SLDISALVKKSTLQQPREQKRKGILGIFGKKKKNEPTITTSMLRSFNRNVISQHVNHQYRLTELADSLMERNLILNDLGFVSTERRYEAPMCCTPGASK
ncbi:MAG: hypothetical protein PUK64_00295, partial [bacterium]|nr:hypothetical protein [bacterium]